MSIVKINPIPSLPPTKSSTSGYTKSGGNKGGNKDGNEGNYSGQTFHDIFKEKLESHSYILVPGSKYIRLSS